MLVLGDFYCFLWEQLEVEVQWFVIVLEIYVIGSLNVFNYQINVEIKSWIVCYVIKNLGKQFKKFGMQVVQDQVWGWVSENCEVYKFIWFYIDEMYLFFWEEQIVVYIVEIWKWFRKWGGILIGII